LAELLKIFLKILYGLVAKIKFKKIIPYFFLQNMVIKPTLNAIIRGKIQDRNLASDIDLAELLKIFLKILYGLVAKIKFKKIIPDFFLQNMVIKPTLNAIIRDKIQDRNLASDIDLAEMFKIFLKILYGLVAKIKLKKTILDFFLQNMVIKPTLDAIIRGKIQDRNLASDIWRKCSRFF